MTPPRERWALALILAAGLLVRVLYIGEFSQAPDFAAPGVDAAYNDWWARSLLSGDYAPPPGEPDPRMDSTPYYRPPGYPFFLAAVYRILGGGYLGPRVVQGGLGLLSALLGYLVARGLGPATALLSAAWIAVYWPFVYFEGELQEPALAVSLLLGLMLAVAGWEGRGPRWPRSLAAGVLAGALAVVRPTFLVLLPVVILWGWGRTPAGGRAAGWLARCCLPCLLGAAVVILPVTARNYAVSGDPVLISSNGGMNLLAGNNPDADGFVKVEIRGLGEHGTAFSYALLVDRLSRRLGRPIRHSEASAIFSRQALAWMADNPGRAASLAAKKAMLLFGPREVGHSKEVELERRGSRVLRLLPPGFPLVLGAALGWLLLRFAGEGRPAGSALPGLLLVSGVLVIAGHVPFFAAGRYRVPAAALLIPVGAHALVQAIAAVREGRRRAPLLAAAMAALCVATFANPTGYRPDPVKWRFDRAIAWETAGRDDRAMEELAAGVRAGEGSAEWDVALSATHFELGVLATRRGDLAGAERSYREALALAPADADALNNLGTVLARQGRLDEAERLFLAAVDQEPFGGSALRNLAIIAAIRGDAGKAEELNRRARALEEAMAGRPR